MNPEKAHLIHLISNGNVEVRCIDKISEIAEKKKQVVIWSGVYDNYESLREALVYGETKGFDVYTTINPTRIPATNRELKPFKRTTRDADILEIRNIFFDFDPVREVGLPATDDQIDLSMEQASKVISFLTAEGWSKPTEGFSGNGAHLLYSTQIPVENAKELRGLYTALDKRFGTDEISFDVSVKNPSRIARCLGTINRKASRRSSCFHTKAVTDGEIVLETVRKLTPPKVQPKTWVKPEGHTDSKYLNRLDLLSRMQSNGMILEEAESGKYFVLCPNHQAHGETGATDSVLWDDNKYLTFYCSHSHCQNIDIHAVNEMI